MTPHHPLCPRRRLLPDVALPAYSYVPGLWPHPHTSPDGHHFSVVLPPLESLSEIRWTECIPYLLGIELFNHGYYWEAHEFWESLWHAAGRKGALADFFKGLIQLAVVGVKLREGKPAGIQAHARRALELFVSVEREIGGLVWGMSLGGLRRFAEEASRHPYQPTDRREPVVVLFGELLWPADAAAFSLPGP